MIKRLKRLREFDVSVQVKHDDFIRPPADTQRAWLLNNALDEFVDDLRALDRHAARFVAGRGVLPTGDRTQADLTDDQIMEDWQIPLMVAMADLVTESHGHVLEIGFGRGVSAELIQDRGVAAHTVIECNDHVVRRYQTWRNRYPDRDIRLAHGKWQDVLDGLGRFDGIFFHTYPLTETEFVEQIGSPGTFAEHFFEHAARHLVVGGVFTYLSFEIDSLSRRHQRELFRHFSRIELEVVRDLAIPDDVQDAWWSDSMVVVKAIR